MDQATCDELRRLSNAIYENDKARREEIDAVLPRPRSPGDYTEEVRRKLLEIHARWEAERDRLYELYAALQEGCDHLNPDGSSAVGWGPCDEARCGFCGRGEEGIDKEAGHDGAAMQGGGEEV